MTEVEMWHCAARARTACDALARHEFDARFAATKEEAAAMVMEFVKPGMKVGFGGSMTVRGMDIQGKAAAAGAIILDHNKPGLEQEEKLRILRSQLTCDLFVSGLNAVTRDGCILNVDANGNRVGAMTFGPLKVVAVAGANKIVGNLDEAFARLEETAAPMNNRRLGRPNPCATLGYCTDCDSPSRSCRIYQILKRKPAMLDFTVILVGENLGF